MNLAESGLGTEMKVKKYTQANLVGQCLPMVLPYEGKHSTLVMLGYHTIV